MSQSLAGKVAIVTGASRGIGRAISIGFAREGASVVLVARTRSQIEAAAALAGTSGGNAVAMECDVSKSRAVEEVVRETQRRFGRIDVLVNNAGTDGTRRPFWELQASELRDVLEVNLMGTFEFSRAVVPHMISRREGNIINVTSGAGVRSPSKRSRSISYTVSKFAAEGLSYAMGVSLIGTGVNVNALRPGYVRTSFQDSWTEEELKRQASLVGEPRSPEAVVPVAAYLAALKPGEMTAESVDAKDWYKSRGLTW